MNKEPLAPVAEKVFHKLQALWNCEYDVSGAIGKRYRRQDELGTPFCITIDFDTLENDTVTLRDRDTMQQTRVPISGLLEILSEKLR
jgi:glycyl-tRNA synthetase